MWCLFQGHTETIFDCSFKPEDSDLLATGSFDGSIKIWRIDTMEAVSLVHTVMSRSLRANDSSQLCQKINNLSLSKEGSVSWYSLDSGGIISPPIHHLASNVPFIFNLDEVVVVAVRNIKHELIYLYCIYSHIHFGIVLQVDTLPNTGTIIYSLSWAPADLNCIAAGTSGGIVFIWDVGKDKILQELTAHKDKKVFCVAWNQKDARRIASAGVLTGQFFFFYLKFC